MRRRLVLLINGLCIGVALGLLFYLWRWQGRRKPLGTTGQYIAPEEEDPARVAQLRAAMATVAPLHAPMPKPGPSDWLAHHKEDGQTFEQYLKCQPVRLTPARHVLYVQPLGGLTPTQRRIVKLTADYMAAYFSTDVRIADDLPLDLVPEKDRRASRGFGMQIHAGNALHNILSPRLPDDAAAYIAFTAVDLYPEESWNFVFGEASLYDRVGIWSLARYGDPDESRAAFQLCLLRTIKVATHETGHMFSLQHCIAHACNMNGSNNMSESDAAPLWECAECLAKICVATGADPLKRYGKLAELCREQGFEAEQKFFENSAKELQAADGPR
jgi:archaemetzincin